MEDTTTTTRKKRDTTTLVKLRAKGPQTWELRFHRPADWPKHVPEDIRRAFHGPAVAARAERQRLERELTDLRAMSPAEARRRDAPTVDAWVAECLDAMRRLRRAPATVVRRAGDWRRYLAPVLTGVRIDQITPEHMDRIHTAVAGRAPSTQSSVFASLGVFLSMAKQSKHIEAVPDMPAIKRPQYTADSLPDDDRARLLAACESLRDRAVLVLGLHGLRRGEIVGVRGEDITRENGGHVLTVSRTVSADENSCKLIKATKTDKARTIPLADDAAAILLEYRDTLRAPSAWLFPGEEPDMPNGVAAVARVLRRVSKRAGVRYRASHILRKSCATALANEGAGEWEIAAHLGHASTAMAAVYVNRARLRSQRVVRGLSTLTGGSGDMG